MKAKWKILIEKARQAMMSAVAIYNNPTITFKSELFIVNSEIAWTYLFHAYYQKNNICYFYRKKLESGKYKYEKIDGRNKEWELSRCLKSEEPKIDEATIKNLEFLIQIRNKIEHSSCEMNDSLISAKIQACSINFNFYIKQLFGPKYGLDKSLCMAIQFSTLNPDQKNTLLNKKAGSNIASIISSYEKSLPNELLENPRYAYRVYFTQVNVNRPNQADQAINFLKANSEQANAINVVIKETEKTKYLPSQIVHKIKENGFTDFNIDKHTKLWKAENAKDPSKHYGVDVAGKWYWYENWFEFVLGYLKEVEIKKL